MIGFILTVVFCFPSLAKKLGQGNGIRIREEHEEEGRKMYKWHEIESEKTEQKESQNNSPIHFENFGALQKKLSWKSPNWPRIVRVKQLHGSLKHYSVTVANHI